MGTLFTDMRTFIKLLAVALVLTFAGRGVPIRAQSQSTQPLGDVAKKEEERRKQVKKPAKVITNDDLKSAPAPDAAPPPPAAASKDQPKTDEKKDDDKAKDPAKDQAYWSGRMKQLQVALDRDTTYSEALQSRINALTTDFVNRDDPVQRGKIGDDRKKAVAELDRLKQQIIDDKKAIADLEEEARRAGVPPGWLRS